MSLDLYQENLIDHYKHPRNFRRMIDADFMSRELNASCGDEVEVFLVVESGMIKEASFVGHGCAVSMAATSMLSENLIGKSLEEVKNYTKLKLDELIGVEVGETRINCELLGLKAFQKSFLEPNI